MGSRLTPLAVLLAVEGAGSLLRGAATGGLVASAVALLAWAAMLLALGSLATRLLGRGAAAFGAVALVGGALVGAPVTFNPLFPWAIRPAMALCPLVAAARAQGLDVIHQPVLYELSSLDALEFHYPAWYVHPILALTAAAALLTLAAQRQEPSP